MGFHLITHLIMKTTPMKKFPQYIKAKQACFLKNHEKNY